MATHMIRGGLAASVLAATVLGCGPAAQAVSPASASTTAVEPSDPITVEVVSVNGSGCPAGTAVVRPLADNTGFTVGYTSYVATAGGAAAPTDFRKNCQLSLLVHVPQGFTYAIARADYAGTARLASGASGLERANYYFQGSAADSYSDHDLSGPLYGRWSATDSTAVADLVYAPCGIDRILNVNTELRVDAGVSTTGSSLRMSSASGSVNTVYHFAWQECS